MSPRASRRATLILVAAAVASTALLVAVAAFAATLLLAPATPVQGQGNVVSEDRTTTSFRRIASRSG